MEVVPVPYDLLNNVEVAVIAARDLSPVTIFQMKKPL